MTSYETHLALREEQRLSRIEAEQEQDVDDLAEDMRLATENGTEWWK